MVTAFHPQEERAARLARALARKANEAKADPAVFFELVMREEHSGSRVAPAPHQRVKLDFIVSHDRCVLREPPGFAKTYTLAAYELWRLGHDATHRFAFIGWNEKIGQKPLTIVRDYIENDGGRFLELAFIFPHLRRSNREQDAWGQNRITIDRPPGIKDPSGVALGAGGGIMGSRLRDIICDDLLDEQNTRTKEQRTELLRWFFLKAYSRRDPVESRIIVSNTPWAPDDLTYVLEGPPHCWPTLSMSAEGDIVVSNTLWESDELRPSTKSSTEVYSTAPEKSRRVYRLKAHDDARYVDKGEVIEPSGKRYAFPAFHPEQGDRVIDSEERVPLWPERYSRNALDQLRGSPQYTMLYKLNPRLAEAEAKCQRGWIEQCKTLARLTGYFKTPERKLTRNFAAMGVDLGFTDKETSDPSAIVVVEYVPSIEIGGRFYTWMQRVLHVRFGHWDLGEIVDNIGEAAALYGVDRVRVETNGGGKYVSDALVESNRLLTVVSHYTGVQNKWHRWFGVEAVFQGFKNEGILIPNSEEGICEPAVEQLVEDCVSFKREGHTGDCLIALWLAREEIRELFGASKDLEPSDPNDPRTTSVGANLTSR